MKGYKHLTNEQRAAILQRYSELPSVTRVAEELQVSREQVRHLLKCSGIVRSGAKNGACVRHIAEVRQWAAEGIALSEIGRRIGSSSGKIGRFLRKNGIPYVPFRQTGENNPAWKGGRQIDKHGYILIHRPDHPEANRHGQVREHRLVMESVLGRPLKQGEVVHHIDENPANNDPANLSLYPSNGKHLEETRKGRAPRLSPEGKERRQEWDRQRASKKRTATRPASSPDDSPSRETTGQTPD